MIPAGRKDAFQLTGSAASLTSLNWALAHLFRGVPFRTIRFLLDVREADRTCRVKLPAPLSGRLWLLRSDYGT